MKDTLLQTVRPIDRSFIDKYIKQAVQNERSGVERLLIQYFKMNPMGDGTEIELVQQMTSTGWTWRIRVRS